MSGESSANATFTAISAEDTSLSILGRWAWGSCGGIERNGNYLVAGNGFLLQSLDVSTPASPFVVSELLLEAGNASITGRDSLVYCVDGLGLNVVEVDRSGQLGLVGQVGLSGIPNRVELADSLAFILSFFGGLKIVSIEDPTQPFLISSIGTGGPQSTCLAVSGRVAYVGSPTYPDIDVFDATDPENIQQSLFQVDGFASYAHAIDSLLFIGLTNGDWRLRIYNITNPLAPAFVGDVWMGSDILGIARKNDRLYVGTADSGLVIVDVSDPTAPVIGGSYRRAVPDGVGGADITIDDSLLYTSLGTGVWTLSIMTADSLAEVSWYPTGSIPGPLAVDSSFLFVPQQSTGLRILNVSDPASMLPIGLAEFNGITSDMAFNGDHAYCIGASFKVVDAMNTSSPVVVGSLSVSGNSIAAGNGLCAIGDDNSISFYDVSDPSAPGFLLDYPVASPVLDIDLDDTLSFLAVRDSGVIILSVSDRENPRRLAKVLDNALSLATENSLLFVATYEGMSVIDVGIPHEPAIVGSVATSGSRTNVDLTVSGQFVYLAYDGLHVIDVSDPTSPVESATLIDDPGPRPNHVSVWGDTIFVSDPSGVWALRNNLPIVGVRAEDLPLPDEIELYQNYPNPFNSTTRIGFFINAGDRITLEMYDVLGNHVATLVNGLLDRGYSSVVLNAENIASGTYFYRLKTSTNSITRRMILIK